MRLALLLVALPYFAGSFAPTFIPAPLASSTKLRSTDVAAQSPTSTTRTAVIYGLDSTEEDLLRATSEWEVDCYSRPVRDAQGKKLWEVLITDSSGSLRYSVSLPSSSVNSLSLRNTIEECITLACDEGSAARPSTMRFFRGEMFNMLSIALSQVDVVARPRRATTPSCARPRPLSTSTSLRPSGSPTLCWGRGT